MARNKIHKATLSWAQDEQGFSELVYEYNNQQKEDKMKDNKHPHYDLIVEWAEDTSKVVQSKWPSEESWCGHHDDEAPIWNPNREYRFKPRQFTKGHWYPCIDGSNERTLYYYDGSVFCLVEHDSYGSQEVDSMKWIGESLGEIDFPG